MPGYPVVPILAALACLFLMGFLILGTWVRFLVWMAIGLLVYFGYSRTHSRLARAALGRRLVGAAHGA